MRIRLHRAVRPLDIPGGSAQPGAFPCGAGEISLQVFFDAPGLPIQPFFQPASGFIARGRGAKLVGRKRRPLKMERMIMR